ncbi:hypothetical protein RCL1_007558 [Eukaryota sp. TZLM3-RCL]
MINDAPCHHRTCGISFSDFSFVSDLSSGSQGSTSMWSGPDGKLYYFKQIPLSSSGRVPEAEFLFRDLRSLFVVDILHCFTIEDQLYLCMEYCQGNSLKNLLESRISLTNDDIWFILTQLSHGLHHLHSNSIIHRDVKPANIVLTSQQRPFRVKYCDFGVSKHLDNTFAKTITGTFLFMAPEVLQLQSKGSGEEIHYTFVVDLWSLGVTLYYLVEGKFPFKNPFEILNSEIPVSNSEFGPIISKLLQRDATQRITAKELIELPEIQEIYDSFYDFDNILSVDFQMWLMKREKQRQSKLLMNLGSLFTSQMANLCAKISSLQSKNHSLFKKVLELESHIDLVSPLSSTTELSYDTSQRLPEYLSQSLDSLQRLPEVSQNSQKQLTGSNTKIITINKKLIELEAKTKSSSNVLPSQTTKVNSKQVVSTLQESSLPLVKKQTPKQSKLNPELAPLIFPNKIYGTMDSLTFIKTTMGSGLSVSKSRLIVTSHQYNVANSFVAINVPKEGSFSLTLSTLGNQSSSSQYHSLIGYFDPLYCQERNPNKHCTGLHVSNSATKFTTSGLGQGSHLAPLLVNDSVTIIMTSTDVTYTISKFNWSKTVPRTTGWVFGIVVVKSGDSWNLILGNSPTPQQETTDVYSHLTPIIFPNDGYGSVEPCTFIKATMGTSLSLPKCRRVRSHQYGLANSFIAISILQDVCFKLTLKSPTQQVPEKCFSFIGYFDPLYCQTTKAGKYFTGIHVFDSGIQFFVSGEGEQILSDVLNVDGSILITATSNEVTYTKSKSKWSRTVPRSTGWVFGMVLSLLGESWLLNPHQTFPVPELQQSSSTLSINEPSTNHKQCLFSHEIVAQSLNSLLVPETNQTSEQPTIGSMEHFLANPFVFLSQHAFFHLFPQVKFLSQVRGSTLNVSNEDTVVLSVVESLTNSFVPISFPHHGTIQLTLERTAQNGHFASWIGFFDPLLCQTKDFARYFRGVCCQHNGNVSYRFTKNLKGKPVSCGDFVQLSFNGSRVSFEIHNHTSSVIIPAQTVFGIAVTCAFESWSLSHKS